MNKSIDKKISVYIFFTILGIFSSLMISRFTDLDLSIVVFVLFIFHITFFLFVVKKQTLYILLKTMSVSALFYVIFFLIFRDLRNFFPAPTLNLKGTVGFVNYFKYPPLFDFFFFIFIVLVPVISFLIFTKYERKN